MDQIISLFPSEQLGHHDISISDVLVELDGALKLNIKKLSNKLEVKSVETLQNAI